MPATPSHVLDYHDQVDLDEQLLHGTAADETFGRTAATPPLPANVGEREIRADERRQVCEALTATGRADAAEFIEAGFRDDLALIDCPRCHGDGEVRFNPSRIRDPQCEQEAPCPDCHGEGTVTRPVICDRCGSGRRSSVAVLGVREAHVCHAVVADGDRVDRSAGAGARQAVHGEEVGERDPRCGGELIGIALIVAGGSLMVWALCAMARQADADLYRHGYLSDEDMAS